MKCLHNAVHLLASLRTTARGAVTSLSSSLSAQICLRVWDQCLLLTHWPLVTLVTPVAWISPCNQCNLSILPQENVELTRVLGGRKSWRSCSSLPRRQDTRPDRASRISCRKGWAISRLSWLIDLIDIDRSISRRDRRCVRNWNGFARSCEKSERSRRGRDVDLSVNSRCKQCTYKYVHMNIVK